MNIPDKRFIVNEIQGISALLAARASYAERVQRILSKLISSIIVHCLRPNYHNYFPDSANSPGRILTRACQESTLQNLENFISARACNTRLEVRISLAYFWFSDFRLRKNIRHSTIRATSLSVKFDAKIQDARAIQRSFAVLCARKKKKKITRSVHESREAKVSSSSIDRTVERLLCLHVSGGNRGISWELTLPVVISLRCVHPRLFLCILRV